MGQSNISNIRTEVKMLSRQAITRATQARNCLVVASRGLAVSTPNPERDLVNYPARVRPIEKAPVRMGIFPEEWFAALYPKTGVTGPYMFLAGVGTFLCSKEFFVMEHDFYVGVGLFAVLSFVVKSVGPDWTASVNKELDDEEAALRSIRQSEIDFCKDAIAQEELSQANTAAWEDIIAAVCLHSGQEEVGLPAGDSQRCEAHGAEAHGGLDHWQCQEVDHSSPGRCCPEEVHF